MQELGTFTFADQAIPFAEADDLVSER
jgi:hypothetical protein